MCAVKAIPEGFHSITPAIVCKGAARAVEYYKEVFHAKEKLRMPGPGGVIMHAELAIGDSILMLSDEFPGMTSAPPAESPELDNFVPVPRQCGPVFNRAVKAGAKVEMPLENQ